MFCAVSLALVYNNKSTDKCQQLFLIFLMFFETRPRVSKICIKNIFKRVILCANQVKMQIYISSDSQKRKELQTVSLSLCLMTLFQIAKIRILYIIVYKFLLKIKIIQIISFPY